ncbi:aminotransferase class V-fold PLP-dependent enzyme [Glaciibacter psychrotolerans]|uniref:Selenocysteine lyase/cysteine desulfurase n=1 Tax=Glaciibacter psychrotolerans TaxID=670054 RepID=A0A7Z0J6D6_9MICO|nr:aminotransferase class V-fold PLP-dependent enzyme [Leifsonia psychrotolerans]NYJ19834.1 selenocysteine lyase/cysteine desulfurase [Leifsonia psychrotolerans]
MASMEQFAAGFLEEPGYLDYARVGPMSAAVTHEAAAQIELLSRARFGSLATLFTQTERFQQAAALTTGFRHDQIVFQPNTTTGLMHAMFGLTGGGVLLSAGDFPSGPFAAVRASEALHVVSPLWLETDHGRVTPNQVKQQLTATTAAVAVCLVDARTGYVADLEGIRQVIGDRLLIVDAIQGFGVIDAPYELADVVASGGQKWARAGWGTGFLALSDRALERLTPVFSGFAGTDEDEVWDEVVPPSDSARAFQVSNPDAIALARFSAALEEINEVGVAAIATQVSENVTRLIDLADEFTVPVTSSRDERERAGIVVLEPVPEQLTLLTASLHNHGVSTTTRQGTVRLSVHARLDAETVEMLRGAFTSFSSAATY